MKKLYFSIFITLVTLTPFVQGKKYTYLPELNNQTSRNCANVRAALFKKGDLESMCDHLEERARFAAEEKRNEGPGGWISMFMGATDVLNTKAALRVILANEPDDEVKFKEYDEYVALIRKLEKEFNEKQENSAKKAAEEKAKRKF